MHMTPELFAIIFGGIGALVLTRVFEGRIDGIARQVAAISRVEGKLDLLLKQAGLEYDAYIGVPSPVVEAIKQGAKIEAIKRYRKGNPASLKVAKAYVEDVQRRAGVA